jgi:N utilization substance protein B
VLTRHLEGASLPAREEEFARRLVEGAVSHRAELDRVIERLAPQWPLEQMAAIDRNVLRIGAYEVLLDEAVPTKVAINEAVELAKLFGTDGSRRLVNGALGSLVRDPSLREEFNVVGKARD